MRTAPPHQKPLAARLRITYIERIYYRKSVTKKTHFLNVRTMRGLHRFLPTERLLGKDGVSSPIDSQLIPVMS